MILNVIAAGEGRPVVLLHGLFGSARNFGRLQRALAGRFRVLAIDLRNHGDSPHAAGMSYAAMAADVREMLAASHALPASVIGHSMGGKVAMRLALDRPDDVSRLLVSDIAPTPYRSGFRAYLDAMRALPPAPDLSRAAADAMLAQVVPDAKIRAFLLQNRRFGERAGWRIGLEEIAGGLPEIEDWDAPTGASYPGPVLFVAGELSDYVKPEHRPAIRELFPHARFVSVKAVGHWIHAEAPEAFEAIAERFLPAA